MSHILCMMAKAKGYDQKCLGKYDANETDWSFFHGATFYSNSALAKKECSVITYHQMTLWLWEFHKINVTLHGNGKADLHTDKSMQEFDTYDEAIIEALMRVTKT